MFHLQYKTISHIRVICFSLKSAETGLDFKKIIYIYIYIYMSCVTCRQRQQQQPQTLPLLTTPLYTLDLFLNTEARKKICKSKTDENYQNLQKKKYLFCNFSDTLQLSHFRLPTEGTTQISTNKPCQC